TREADPEASGLLDCFQPCFAPSLTFRCIIGALTSRCIIADRNGLGNWAARTGSVESATRMSRRVTFSRNLTLSLSRTCRCYCKYCSFATHGAHLYSPEEVVAILDGAARRHVKELLVLTG